MRFSKIKNGLLLFVALVFVLSGYLVLLTPASKVFAAPLFTYATFPDRIEVSDNGQKASFEGVKSSTITNNTTYKATIADCEVKITTPSIGATTGNIRIHNTRAVKGGT